MKAAHAVRKQVVDLRLSRRKSAFALQDEVSRLCRDRVPAVLEEVCDAAWPGPDSLRIDRLEIDLGRLAPGNLESAFLDRLRLRMGEALREWAGMGMAGEKGSSRRDAVGEGPLDSLAHSNSPGSVEASGVKFRKHEILESFLRTGVLPWWVTPASPESDIDSLALELAAETPTVIPGFLRRILKQEESIRRLAFQFQDAVQEKWASPFLNLGAGMNFSVLRKALTSFFTSTYRGSGNAQFWMVFWKAVSRQGAPLEMEKAIPAILRGLKPGWEGDAWKRLAENLPGSEWAPLRRILLDASAGGGTAIRPESASEPLPRPEVARAKELAPGVSNPTTVKSSTSDAAKADLELSGPRRDRVVEAQTFAPKKADQTEKTKKTERPENPEIPSRPFSRSGYSPTAMVDGENQVPEVRQLETPAPESTPVHRAREYRVENSGLVILWPFLPTFFSDLGLLREGGFPGSDERMRAAQLLHFLASGRSEAHEWELPLCKLLCGWSLEAALPRQWEILEREKEEGETLLRAVIGHWSALRSTSVEGLRSSFLLRTGMLQERPREWLLRVERKAHDLLLEKLPWSHARVAPAWMDLPLRVEW